MIVLLGLMHAPVAGARDLNNVELFRRCYGQLTGRALKVSDPRISALESGNVKAIDLCEELIEKASLDDGDGGRLVNRTDEDARAVLRKMYQIFNTFVSKSSPGSNTSLSGYFDVFSPTEDIQDFTAPALVFTENLLNPKRDFKDIFSISRTPAALREIDTQVTYPFSMRLLYGSPYLTTDHVMGARSRHGLTFRDGGTTPVNPDLVPLAFRFTTTETDNQAFTNIPVGELVGINFNSPAQVPFVSNPTRTTHQGMPLAFDNNTTLFKGAPFLRTYIMTNAQFFSGNGNRPNLEFTHRRLSASILKDYLCRDLPVVRASDSARFISQDANALPFRKGASCVQCHATADQMAGVYRGLGYISTGTNEVGDLHRYALMVQKSPPVSGQTAESGWPALKDTNYYRRPAKGHFLYRSINGALINAALESGDSLSEIIAQQDDAYICHAKKLFKYFTGVNVELSDIYDPDQAEKLSSMSKKDWEYRNIVIRLGRNLKQHQKVRKTISEIMHLEIYKQADFGGGEL
ncbi:MAG: hypothetical protein HC902_06775 [Calothrix sp. SM1_5_4]|nr:hypothetical protein [Calothrix sp. SM1_5_4]